MVRSVSVLRAAGFTWQAHHGGWVLSIIAKATYDLLPTESRLSERQEDIVAQDNHWNDDPQRSIYAPSDLAPFKPRADITVVGHAFSPGGDPVRQLIARVVVGDADKSIAVVGERTFGPDGDVREGARFAKMPLRYERAAGGPETKNPVGMRLDTQDSYGRTPLPNLQPPGLVVATRGDFIEPIGFGPVAPSWPERRDRLAQFANDFSPAGWPRSPLPESFDFAYFNAAPRDQQIAALRDDERIVLENLHVEHARLVTSLPGLHPKAFVDREGSAPFPIRMTCDTLWIDTDSAIATLTWRAQLPVESRVEPAVYVALEEKGAQIWWADVEPLVRRLRTGSKVAQVAASSEARRVEAELERTVAPESDAGERTLMPFGRTGPESAALPFKANRATIALPVREDRESTTLTEHGVNPLAGAPAWLGGQSAVQPAPQAPPVAPQPQPRASGYPAPPPPAPPALLSSMVSAESPWSAQPGRSAVGERSWSPQPPPAHPSAMPPQPSVPPAVANAERNWLNPTTAAAPAESPLEGRRDMADAAQRGALAASNAAADAPRPVEAAAGQSRAPAAEPVERSGGAGFDLLWYDAARLPKMRKALAPRGSARFERDWTVPETADRDEVTGRERGEILRLLGRTTATELGAIGRVLGGAFDADGGFEPPIVVLAGELRVPFEKHEWLASIASIAGAFSSPDKRLKDALALAAELAGPGAKAPPDLLDAAVVRIREAFDGVYRGMSGPYLDARAERSLLVERKFQEREVFGLPCIRGELSGEHRSTGSELPFYLPEALRARWPLFSRLPIRAVVELRHREDEGESHAHAALVLALAREIKRS